jgi:DNA adenine methylase
MSIQKPFLKWAGGKTQILNKIIPNIPTIIKNYHELFLGGGSVLLAILSLKKQNKIKINGKIYAYDINPILIHTYNMVQTNKDELLAYITEFKKIFSSIETPNGTKKPQTIEEAMSSKESYYYWTRNEFNKIDKNTVDAAALFIILNKTCFRGLYREGPNGFNVPYGHYKKMPAIITKSELDMISELISDVIFECRDFQTSIKNIKQGDFTYLDPPYAPEIKTSFVGYVKGGFGLNLHQKLFAEVKKLYKKNIKFAMSNAKVPLVLESFNENEFNYEDIKARRAINSKNPAATTIEVLIYN